eukprot:9254362-Alexandrium_andersonii.AAC.1
MLRVHFGARCCPRTRVETLCEHCSTAYFIAVRSAETEEQLVLDVAGYVQGGKLGSSRCQDSVAKEG